MPSPSAIDHPDFDAARQGGMRIRLAAMAVLNILIWGSHALLYEDLIFPDRAYATPYRLAQAAHCLGLLWLASRRLSMRDLELGATILLATLMPIHALAMLVVHEECLVPFLLTMEWSQPVVALAMLLSFRYATALFVATWLSGVATVLLRPGFDADLTDHAVLALIYAVVAASIRSHDGLRVREFVARGELETANVALRQADEARSRLFTNLSHDLRTPLTLIRGEARVLSGALSEEGQGALLRIERHTGDVADLADQLLEAARLDAGRLEPAAVAVDLGSLVTQAGAQFSGGASSGKIAVVCPEPASGGVAARVDPAHLRRIVWNLLGNATRQLTQGASRVSLRVSAEGGLAVLDVTNDGPPIPAERRQRIFERFSAFDAGGGVRSGIGLPLARELAELNGGTLSLLEGEPTTFRLTLPSTDEQPAPLGPFAPRADGGQPSPGVSPPGEGPTVLVVEDHEELREFLVRLLGARFSVVSAGSVASATHILERHTPAVVLCDLMLPDGRGYDVLEWIRARPERFAGVPLVFLSAVADENEKVMALAAGAADFVAKPFGTEELLARVEGARERGAERRRALDEQREDFLSELHDGVSSALARAALLLESAAGPAPGLEQRRAEVIQHARAAVRDALEETRALVIARRQRLVPWREAVLDLETMLRETAAPFECEIDVSDATDGSVFCLSTEEHHALCRIAVEAVTNAVKHGETPSIEARLAARAGEVYLSVTNTTGAPTRQGVEAFGMGFGLRAARRRAVRLGGTLSATVPPQGGFQVEARFPAVSARVAGAA